MEIIAVLIIIGIAAALSFPNYTTSTEQARAANAQNNLLAIYSAEKNYYNNYGSYCTITTGNAIPCGDTLPDLNTNLSLNIQDDGTYKYSCSNPSLTCTATRISTGATIVLTLNLPIQLTGSSPNPQCNLFPSEGFLLL